MNNYEKIILLLVLVLSSCNNEQYEVQDLVVTTQNFENHIFALEDIPCKDVVKGMDSIIFKADYEQLDNKLRSNAHFISFNESSGTYSFCYNDNYYYVVPHQKGYELKHSYSSSGNYFFKFNEADGDYISSNSINTKILLDDDCDFKYIKDYYSRFDDYQCEIDEINKCVYIDSLLPLANVDFEFIAKEASLKLTHSVDENKNYITIEVDR